MNVISCIGRIVKPLEIKDINGTALLNFTIAIQKDFKDKDGKYGADFCSCVAWRQQATFIAKYFNKGDKIAIIGSLSTRQFDGTDGKRNYVTEIYVKSAEFVENKNGKEYTASGTIDTKKDGEPDFYPTDDDLSLPFDL